ncbi:MAG TPA: hypothetical protein VMW41_02985 [Candidatus Bathyarchaeia archaeon]|nr:hypothetical protein [Candidatus Bathyarchaeia archaeon]
MGQTKVSPQPPQQVILGEKNQSASKDCITIQDGKLTYSPGHYLDETPISTGYDEYGYNYQAHMFNGSYANVYLGGGDFPPYKGNDVEYLAENPGAENEWYWPYRDVELLMRWNDSWIANQDCDDDGLLDRHFGNTSYVGSGAWETNHQSGVYEVEGRTCKWNYFVKIVAVPADAILENGIWKTANGAEIGLDIWGQFAIIQQIYNDPCEGSHGVEYLSPAGPGFGKWK